MNQHGFPSSVLETGLDEQTLTASYADNSFDIDLRNVVKSGDTSVGDKSHLFNTLTIMFEYQLGDGETNNTIDFQVQNGPSDTDLFIATASAVSSGTVTLSDAAYQWQGANATAPYKRSFSVEISDRYLSILVKESGVVSNFGTVTVKYFLSRK